MWDKKLTIVGWSIIGILQLLIALGNWSQQNHEGMFGGLFGAFMCLNLILEIKKNVG
jgi:uncharacterized membrane protein